MSFQWTFIAGYLYFEVAVVIIMLLPVISPGRWNQFFKSRLFAMFKEHAALYFYMFLGLLSMFLMDAVREMRKYSHSMEANPHVHLSREMKGSIKLFRAQRNFYITGFAIFLSFVIRRLATMLIIQDELRKKTASILKEVKATENLTNNTLQGNYVNILQASEDKCDEMKLKLDTTMDLLKQEQSKAKDLDEEVKIWKLKYEESITAVDN